MREPVLSAALEKGVAPKKKKKKKNRSKAAAALYLWAWHVLKGFSVAQVRVFIRFCSFACASLTPTLSRRPRDCELRVPLTVGARCISCSATFLRVTTYVRAQLSCKCDSRFLFAYDLVLL
ncbi:hypothetical protein TRVL_00121 [Trypanosoma vivax]|nr:hypothetical protein TRVL_00121 [Trypanosoma vivax]